jgi:hypothetical protein
MPIGQIFRRAWRQTRRLIRWTIGVLIFAALVQRSTPITTQLDAIFDLVRGRQFDFIAWEIDALIAKARQFISGEHAYMDEAARSDFVRRYFADLAEAQSLEGQIDAIYANPTVRNPAAATLQLRQQRDALRSDLRRRQPLMEAILEGQVAAVLVEQGFGVLGQLWPPMAMHFTQVPNLLVISPRDRIARRYEISLDPLPIDAIAALEDRLMVEQDVSALIVPLGGIALYPAMILETSSLPLAVTIFAHEWTHHYFYFFPLGLSYNEPEARAINETAADIVGREVGRRVLERYYPEYLAQVIPAKMSIPARPAMQGAPFDFRAEMRATRIVVDHYLATAARLQTKLDALIARDARAERSDHIAAQIDARVAEAEAFMEQRRLIFFENGYSIRRLNQAYFAFYGSYQAGGVPGVAGEDPIGPAVAEIRAASDDLGQFIAHLRGITTTEGLLRARARVIGE